VRTFVSEHIRGAIRLDEPHPIVLVCNNVEADVGDVTRTALVLHVRVSHPDEICQHRTHALEHFTTDV
jgi:hypothetical protein